MTSIKINVNKQSDGYSFSITPSGRSFIKKIFPDAIPLTSISLKYDVKSDFNVFAGRLEDHIYPALLGVDNKSDLDKLGEILFIDLKTGSTLYKITAHHDKKRSEKNTDRILSYAGLFSDMPETDYKDFLNHTRKIRRELFDRTADL